MAKLHRPRSPCPLLGAPRVGLRISPPSVCPAAAGKPLHVPFWRDEFLPARRRHGSRRGAREPALRTTNRSELGKVQRFPKGEVRCRHGTGTAARVNCGTPTRAVAPCQAAGRLFGAQARSDPVSRSLSVRGGAVLRQNTVRIWIGQRRPQGEIFARLGGGQVQRPCAAIVAPGGALGVSIPAQFLESVIPVQSLESL